MPDDPLAHLDFPTEFPFDPVLIGARMAAHIMDPPRQRHRPRIGLLDPDDGADAT